MYGCRTVTDLEIILEKEEESNSYLPIPNSVLIHRNLPILIYFNNMLEGGGDYSIYHPPWVHNCECHIHSYLIVTLSFSQARK